MGLCQNTLTPEGALRCRAVASGLKGPGGGIGIHVLSEDGRNLGMAPIQVNPLENGYFTGTNTLTSMSSLPGFSGPPVYSSMKESLASMPLSSR